MKNETVTRRTVRGSSVHLGVTLLLNPIPQKLAAGWALAMLDSHGDLGETVLLHAAGNRSNVIMPR